MLHVVDCHESIWTYNGVRVARLGSPGLVDSPSQVPALGERVGHRDALCHGARDGVCAAGAAEAELYGCVAANRLEALCAVDTLADELATALVIHVSGVSGGAHHGDNSVAAGVCDDGRRHFVPVHAECDLGPLG